MNEKMRSDRSGRVGVCAVLAATLLAASGPASLMAQEDLEKPPAMPESETPAAPQPLPPKVQDEQIEPSVTIREEEGRRVEEYRFNGRVYMVKVTPAAGPPYYFVDTDGDGSLETSPDKGLAPVKPIHWKIKEFD